MSKILVTGGAGFIGSNLVDRLVEDGHEVAVLDDLSTGKVEYLNPRAKLYHLTIVESKRVHELMAQEKFEYVFHLAAQISVMESVHDPLADNEVNARGSYNVFHAANQYGVKKVIFISTGGALYGNVTEPASESTCVEPTSPYAIHKFTAERYLALFQKEHGLAAIVLRLANVYGPRQFKGGEGAAVAVFSNNAINNLQCTIYGDGSKTRDYIYVGDVVDACLAAMKSDYQGVVNIGTGKRISVLELLKTIERASSQKINYIHGQDRPGEVQDSILSIAKAKTVLNWQPQTSLETGLERTLAWSRSNAAG